MYGKTNETLKDLTNNSGPIALWFSYLMSTILVVLTAGTSLPAKLHLFPVNLFSSLIIYILWVFLFCFFRFLTGDAVNVNYL